MAPVSSSAPGRGDCPALIPTLIIFKAVGFISHSCRRQWRYSSPRKQLFWLFFSCLVGRDCNHGCERCSGTTEASGQLAGFGCVPDSDCFSTCTNGLNIHSSATQQGYSVTEILSPSQRNVHACSPGIHLHRHGRSYTGTFVETDLTHS